MAAAESLSISFEDIFGPSPEDVTPERLEQFLNEVMADTFKSLSRSPNELVRVVEEGRITWMTVEQAEQAMQSQEGSPDEKRQKNIEKVLYTDPRIISQELRVLLLLGMGTLNLYREKQQIPLSEIQRVEPQLLRVGRQVNFLLSELKEIEARMKEARRKNPLIEEFESKMGDLLVHQKEGQTDEAVKLARELASLKTRYVFLSRGLNSFQNDSYRVRTDLQRQKKGVLSCQRYLAAQREGAIQVELQDLRKGIDNIKSVLARESQEKQQRYKELLSEREEKVDLSQRELSAVQREQTVLEQKEKETEAVISHIQNKILDSIPTPEPLPPETVPETAKPEEKPAESAAPPPEKSEKHRGQRIVHRG